MRLKGQNKTYFGSEKSILDAFSRLLTNNRSMNIRIADITREADLAVSSFYIHYRSVKELMEINEKRIMDEINKAMRLYGFDRLTPQGKWRNILFAMYKYREIVDIMVKTRNYGFLEEVLDEIENFTSSSQLKNKSNNENLNHIVKLCLIAELDFWQKEKFSVDKIPEHAAHLAFMASCAPRFFARMFY